MNKPSKKPTGLCNAYDPCKLFHNGLCFSSSNCQNCGKFDENKDELFIDKILSIKLSDKMPF